MQNLKPFYSRTGLVDMDMVDMNMVDMNMVDMNMVDMNMVDSLTSLLELVTVSSIPLRIALKSL